VENIEAKDELNFVMVTEMQSLKDKVQNMGYIFLWKARHESTRANWNKEMESSTRPNEGEIDYRVETLKEFL